MYKVREEKWTPGVEKKDSSVVKCFGVSEGIDSTSESIQKQHNIFSVHNGSN